MTKFSRSVLTGEDRGTCHSCDDRTDDPTEAMVGLIIRFPTKWLLNMATRRRRCVAIIALLLHLHNDLHRFADDENVMQLLYRSWSTVDGQQGEIIRIEIRPSLSRG